MIALAFSMVLSAASCPAPSAFPPPGTCHFGPGNTPDPNCTPGDVDTTLTEDDICNQPTEPRRCKPPRPVREAAEAAYGVDDAATGEIDHLISLELGGSNDAKNLWPQPSPDFKAKDRLENRLHHAVCIEHTLTLAAAQKLVVDFVTTMQRSPELARPLRKKKKKATPDAGVPAPVDAGLPTP